MAKKSSSFGLLILILFFGIIIYGCDVDDSGYKIQTYKITYSTYTNRPAGITDDKALSYVKNAYGTVSEGSVWHSRINGVKDLLTEKLGYLSNMNEVLGWIESDYTTVIWFSPGLLSTVQDNYFFYVENNNQK
jgi:hypothetical protein